MPARKRSTIVARVVLGALATIALIIGVSGTAQASNPASAPAPIVDAPASSWTATLVPDCANLTASARQYAIDHNIKICGLNSTTRNTVPGLCGSSGIFIYQGPSSGQARINYGFSSTVGTIVTRSLVVSWAGAVSGSYTDFSLMGATSYSNNIVRTTGRGLAGADLGGTVLTSWGLVCYMNGPHDSRVIN